MFRCDIYFFYFIPFSLEHNVKYANIVIKLLFLASDFMVAFSIMFFNGRYNKNVLSSETVLLQKKIVFEIYDVNYMKKNAPGSK